MSTITLVAGSMAAKNAFLQLKNKLESQGHSVCELYLVGGGGSDKHFITEQVMQSDVLVTGMAHSPTDAANEIFSINVALEHNVPVYLYADTFGAAFREWFAPVVERVTGIFVVNEEEAELVRETYESAHVISTGNPDWYKQREPSMNRTEAREQLGVEDDETFLVLVPGTKQEFADLYMVGCVVEVLLESGRPFKVVYSIHPGTPLFGRDKKDEDVVREVLKQLIRLPSMKDSYGAVTLLPKAVSTEQAQCGADAIVECMSTAGMVAAMRQQPVVTFFSQIFVRHMEYLSMSPERYTLTVSGASEEFDTRVDPGSLGEILDICSGTDGVSKRVLSHQQKAQRDTFGFTDDPCELMYAAMQSNL